KLPYVSNVTGTWIEAGQATDPGYWASHLRQPVRFAAGLQALLQKPQQVLLEVGPGQTLGKLAKPWLGKSGAVALASTRSAHEQGSDLEVLLGALGRLWASGAEVDWKGFHARERRRRVPLPTYPFERQRYWVEPRAPREAPSPAGVAEKKPDVADWFYVPSWKSAPRPPPVHGPAIAKGAWLLFADASGVASALAPRLSHPDRPVVQVVPGNDFRRREDGVYEIDPRRREQYTALFKALQERGHSPGGIVHLWNMAPPSGSLEDALDAGFHGLVSFAQALAEHGPGQPVRCWVVTSGAAKVESGDTVFPERAMLLAPCQVLPQEHPHVSCSVVDVGLRGAGAPTLADQLFAELHARTPEPIVSYRGRQRWTHRLEPWRLDASIPPVRALRDGGAYLVTDGLAGVGWVVAGELARAHRARLALVEAAGFPPEDGWARWLAAHGPDDATSRKIRNAQALAAAGATVLVLGADLGDQAQVKRAVEQATARFGRLDGVIHAAGGLQGASFQTLAETTPAACARYFAPQVHGVLALERALAAQPPDFGLLLSSLCSVLGGVGQVAYAAASHFMDAFAEQRGDSGPLAWLCVDWDAWQLEDGPSMEAISPDLARLAILPAEGLEATRRLITQVAAGRVVVSTCGLDARRSGPSVGESRPAPTTHARPALATPYVEPGTELERNIARVY
ncbi:MAG TPA: SDR family oxidoreductase, partial [Myxococcales bacterium]|nr:SDR family oxidoreductase [Myxococcales bacterium]